jgi:hypothetical protein
MLLLEVYISNFTRARYYRMFQKISGQVGPAKQKH